MTATELSPAAGPRAVISFVVTRIGLYLTCVIIGVFFALPLSWLLLAPFDKDPKLYTEWPSWTLANFEQVVKTPYVGSSLVNSVIYALATMALVVVCASLASYALSRVRIPGRDLLLYIVLLFSSIVTGTAAMVPLFLMIFDLGLINTYIAVILVLAGGLLPAAIFILKDFMDGTPRSYEESARVFGASPLRILKDVVLPVVRPGLAVIAVWAIVNVWGTFLIPAILIRTPEKYPASVQMYTFYTEAGQADLRLISAFSFLYAIPVVIMYAIVNKRYGFRFHGGIKG